MNSRLSLILVFAFTLMTGCVKSPYSQRVSSEMYSPTSALLNPPTEIWIYRSPSRRFQSLEVLRTIEAKRVLTDPNEIHRFLESRIAREGAYLPKGHPKNPGRDVGENYHVVHLMPEGELGYLLMGVYQGEAGDMVWTAALNESGSMTPEPILKTLRAMFHDHAE